MTYCWPQANVQVRRPLKQSITCCLIVHLFLIVNFSRMSYWLCEYRLNMVRQITRVSFHFILSGDVPIHDFTPCQFEENTCGWQDVSVGQFKWDRDRNGTTTENTGPSVDHTTGTEMGEPSLLSYRIVRLHKSVLNLRFSNIIYIYIYIKVA